MILPLPTGLINSLLLSLDKSISFSLVKGLFNTITTPASSPLLISHNDSPSVCPNNPEPTLQQYIFANITTTEWFDRHQDYQEPFDRQVQDLLLSLIHSNHLINLTKIRLVVPRLRPRVNNPQSSLEKNPVGRHGERNDDDSKRLNRDDNNSHGESFFHSLQKMVHLRELSLEINSRRQYPDFMSDLLMVNQTKGGSKNEVDNMDKVKLTLPSLTHLSLARNYLKESDVILLTTHTQFPSLESFDVSNNFDGMFKTDETVGVFLTWLEINSPSLYHLNFNNTWLPRELHEPTACFYHSPVLEKLTFLDLSRNPWGWKDGWEKFFNSKWIRKNNILTTFHFNENKFSYWILESMIDCLYSMMMTASSSNNGVEHVKLPSLEFLSLKGCSINELYVEILCQYKPKIPSTITTNHQLIHNIHPLSQLSALNLDWNTAISDRSLKMIANASHFSNLKTLIMSSADYVSPLGLVTLAQSKHITKLTTFVIGGIDFHRLNYIYSPDDEDDPLPTNTKLLTKMFATSPNVQNLQHLSLSGCNVGSASGWVVEALFSVNDIAIQASNDEGGGGGSLLLPQKQHLLPQKQHLLPQKQHKFIPSSLNNLHHLNLSDTQLRDFDLETLSCLLTSSILPNLEVLDISLNEELSLNGLLDFLQSCFLLSNSHVNHQSLQDQHYDHLSISSIGQKKSTKPLKELVIPFLDEFIPSRLRSKLTNPSTVAGIGGNIDQVSGDDRDDDSEDDDEASERAWAILKNLPLVLSANSFDYSCTRYDPELFTLVFMCFGPRTAIAKLLVEYLIKELPYKVEFRKLRES